MEKIKFLLKGLASTLTFSLILFVSAGKVDYSQGWIYLTTNLLVTILNFLSIRNNEELIMERSKPGEGIKSWDKLLLGMSGIIFLVTIILAGLDSGRYQWTPDLHWSLPVTGILLTFAGQVVFLAARSQNKFFSSVVRIQTDRGHTVCDSGIYHVVRHPGYLGMIIAIAGIPLLVGSFWSAIPTAIAMVLLLIRTSLEDKTLKNELKGYPEYTLVTRYKLIPGIW
jgi:protein-S-isoprenylcysteine O-methyltransferase Ste14